MFMNPGKIITKTELKETFRFTTEDGIDHFLNMCEDAAKVNPYFDVITLMDERMLVFEEEYWTDFVVFMKQMGYNHEPEV